MGSLEKSQPNFPLDGLHVLVIDDQEDIRLLLSTILLRSGARVTTAASAAEGLDVLASHEISVILCDICMPETDGYSFIRSQRAREGCSCSIPAAAVSAYTQPEDRDLALRSGFQMHLPKPVRANDLVVAVQRLNGLR